MFEITTVHTNPSHRMERVFAFVITPVLLVMPILSNDALDEILIRS